MLTPTAPKPLDGLAGRFGSILVDPPWRFQNRTGKMAPEHRRLRRYETMTFEEIAALPVGEFALPQSHLYLWTPNALIQEALGIMSAWGFTYKTNLVWLKVRKDGEPDGRGVGFYFRNVTELILFGIRGKLRTREAGRRQTNAIVTRKQEHSWKPDDQYRIIESCSPGPYLELFARRQIPGWTCWGNQAETYEEARPLVKGYNGHALSSTEACGPSPRHAATASHPAGAVEKKRNGSRKSRSPEAPGLLDLSDN